MSVTFTIATYRDIYVTFVITFNIIFTITFIMIFTITFIVTFPSHYHHNNCYSLTIVTFMSHLLSNYHDIYNYIYCNVHHKFTSHLS